MFFILLLKVLVLVQCNSSFDVAPSSNKFGFNIFLEIQENQPEENLVFSPFSLFSVFGLLLGGCGGVSSSQVLDLMEASRYLGSENEVYEGISKISKDMNDRKGLNIFHGVFLAESFKVLDSYIDFAAESFDAEVKRVIFPEPGTTSINDWVERKTEGKIRDFLSGLGPLTRAVLINTLFFKNSWKTPFEKYNTRDHLFTLTNDEVGSHQIKMMEMEEEIDFGTHEWEGEVFKSATLPFEREDEEEGDFDMIFILPSSNRYDDTLRLENVLFQQENAVEKILNEQYRSQVHLKIPRFEMKWKSNLNDVLKELGLTSIFDPYTCDLSKMSDNPDLYVSQVLQQTYIKVDEEGCEAAAASAIVINELSAKVVETENSFFADRPFLFMIVDRSSTSVLFMGLVMKPEEPEISEVGDQYRVWVSDGDVGPRDGILVTVVLVSFLLFCCIIVTFVLKKYLDRNKNRR